MERGRFEGSSGSGSSVSADPGPGGLLAASATGKHRAKLPRRARLCIRKSRHARPRCTNFRHVTPPALAKMKRHFTTAGHFQVHVPLSKIGRLLLMAGREADRLYHRRHPHSHKLPPLLLKVTLTLKPSG